MTFPSQHRAEPCSTNLIERLDGDIERRTAVVGILPDEAATTRLVGALLLEQNDQRAVRGPRDLSLETVARTSDEIAVSSADTTG